MDQDVWGEPSQIIHSNALFLGPSHAAFHQGLPLRDHHATFDGVGQEEAFQSISEDSAPGQNYHTPPSTVPYGAQDPNNNNDHNTAEADIPVASGSLPPEPSVSGRDPLRSDAGSCLPSVVRLRELEWQIARKKAQDARERAVLLEQADNAESQP